MDIGIGKSLNPRQKIVTEFFSNECFIGVGNIQENYRSAKDTYLQKLFSTNNPKKTYVDKRRSHPRVYR